VNYSLVKEYNKLALVLSDICWVCKAYNPAKSKTIHPEFEQFICIWDTGATNSVITKKVALKLGLVSSGIAKIQHAHGETEAETYYVNIKLRNNVEFLALKVTEGVLGETDVLIGMDIIHQGDFAISRINGNTKFTFQVPPTHDFDFTKEKMSPVVKTTKPGRNDPCPCGSGKKYKNCCALKNNLNNSKST
jgi:hypothetical protein